MTRKSFVKNEKARFVSFSVDPFTDQKGEKPPEWLELAGDLAWTATFSSLTSNTSVTEPSAVWNYAVFFCLTWHLWATQTTYDIRYYTNDWWHRILFASQLGVYAILAAFSGSFNVGWQLDSDAMDVFKGNATELTAQAMDGNQEYLITKSFRAVNALLFTSRMLLFAQYVRVMIYRKRSNQFSSWRFLLTPLSLVFSGGIFLGCFIMIKDDPDSKPVALIQLILWGVAVISQAIAGAFTPEDKPGVLKSKGEGLNAICGTLSSSMNSLGLSKTMAGQSLTTLFILYFIWLLYFDGFKIEESQKRILEELWLYLHFPLHLSLILLLEGIKNVFIYVNVMQSFVRLDTAFSDVINVYDSTRVFVNHPRLEKLLRVLKMSWQQEKIDLEVALKADLADPTGSRVNAGSQLWRWWGTVIHNVILVSPTEALRDLFLLGKFILTANSAFGMAHHQLYNAGQTDPEAEFKFNEFISSNDTALANDFDDPRSPLLAGFYNIYFDKMAYTGHWILAMSGTLILCMAIVNTVQRQPKNRFAWGYSVSRLIIGVALIIVGGFTSKWVERDTWITWILPAVAIGYGLGVVVDWFILLFSVRSIRNKEEYPGANFARSRLEGDYDHGTGGDPAHPSHSSSGEGTPHRSDSAPTGMYVQGPMGSSTPLYAAGGEQEKLHQGGQYHLPYKP
ncbi:hypothetical protein FRC05_007597 [Tulasnella sp. 425]|nr:hypothetical protein FRC05_007597 [Tulasnella sp. 425]